MLRCWAIVASTMRVWSYSRRRPWVKTKAKFAFWGSTTHVPMYATFSALLKYVSRATVVALASVVSILEEHRIPDLVVFKVILWSCGELLSVRNVPIKGLTVE